MVNGYAPKTLAEALELRSKYDLIPYAGGTDLMVENRPNVSYLFLGKLAELKGISEDADYVRIGAAVTYTEALSSPMVPQLMKEAISRIAAPAIRNAGTFGGNLGNGSAKADSVLIEFVTGAKLRLLSVRGERIVDVEQFYLGRKKLDLHNDEIIAEILLPRPVSTTTITRMWADATRWPSPVFRLRAFSAWKTAPSRAFPPGSARWPTRCCAIVSWRLCSSARPWSRPEPKKQMC